MSQCECIESHPPKKIVVTGGPGAGKTAVLELVRRSLCEHVHVVRESASVVFGGGFPRTPDPEGRRAAQRAIFYVQRELEAAASSANAAILLCDRATIDGAAYWPGPGELWAEVGTTLGDQLAHYDAVIHLAPRRPRSATPIRIRCASSRPPRPPRSTRIAKVWASHPRRYEVAASTDFLAKAARAIDILRLEMVACCHRHLSVFAK